MTGPDVPGLDEPLESGQIVAVSRRNEYARPLAHER